MTNLADIHAAAAARTLSRPERPCQLCGTSLRTAANEPADLFEPVDASGSRTGRDLDVAHWFDPDANPLGAESPYDALNKMAELMEAAHKAVPENGTGGIGRKACLTPLYWTVARAYSMLKVRLDMGLSFHVHHAESDFDPLAPRRPCPPDLPHHCGRPAWLRPSGWHCRECGLVLDDGTAEFPGRPLTQASGE